MIQLINKPLKIKNVLRYFRHLGTLEYLGTVIHVLHIRVELFQYFLRIIWNHFGRVT